MYYAKDMQMKHIIYERLYLSHRAPITYKEFFSLSFSLLLFPSVKAGMMSTTLSDHSHTKQAHPQKRLQPGYHDCM